MTNYTRPLRLSELIKKLEAFDPDAPVRFSFCNLTPTEFQSWRGSYAQLALGFSDGLCNVSHLLTHAKDIIGEQLYGYKGGAYRMTEDTPIWVDNWGRFSETALVDLELRQSTVFLITQYIDFTQLPDDPTDYS